MEIIKENKPVAVVHYSNGHKNVIEIPEDVEIPEAIASIFKAQNVFPKKVILSPAIYIKEIE